MRKASLRGLSSALALSMAVILSACSSTGTTTNTRTSYSPDTGTQENSSQYSGKAKIQGDETSVSYEFPPDDALLLLEITAPAEARVGDDVTYRVRAENVSDLLLADVVVNSWLEEWDTNRTRQRDNQRPAQAPGLRAGESFELGNLQPGQQETFTLRGQAFAEGNLKHCFNAEFEPLVCLVTNVTQPELRIRKSLQGGNSGPRLACEPITYTIVVENSGSGSIDDVVLTDELPDGLRLEDGNRTFRRDVGTLGAGESKEFNVTVRADEAGSFRNRAMVEGGDMSEQTPFVDVDVVKPVLEIEKEAPAVEYETVPLRYTITVRNTGDGPARDTVLTDTLPQGATVLNAGSGNASGNTVTWNLGTIEAGDSRTVNLAIRPGGQGTLTNRACVTAYCAEDVCDTTETDIVGVAAILLEMVDSPDPVRVGTNTTYTIRVTNQGTKPDEDIRVRALIPDNMSYVDSAGPTQGTATGQDVSFAPLRTLGAGQQATWTITVRGDSPGDVRFKVMMNTSTIGSTPVAESEATNVYDANSMDTETNP